MSIHRKKIPLEQRIKISLALRGKCRPDEVKDQLSVSATLRKKKTCEYCHRQFHPGMYARFHGPKCKQARLVRVEPECGTT